MTRDRLLELSTAPPPDFRPFTLRVDGLDIDVSHPNMVAFHPELPWVVIYTSEGVREVYPENISLVTVDHVK